MATTEKTGLRWHLWLVAGAAFAAALVMVLVVFRRQGVVDNVGDPYEYGKIAHGFVTDGFTKLTRRAASLYPTFLSIVFRLGGGNSAVQFIQCGLHAGTCTLVYVMGRRWFTARAGLIAGLFCAIHPMLLRYVADLHMETWLTFWLTLTVWRAVHFYERPSVRNGVLLGVVGTIALLSKGVALPVMLAYGAFWLYRLWKRAPGTAKSLPAVLAMGLTMAVMIAPWTYRNYQHSGRFVLLTPGTPDAFLRGYIFTRTEFITLQKPPYTDAENESNALFRRIAKENNTTWELDEVQDDVNNSVEMKRMIREHPFLTVRKVVVGFFTFWYEMTSLRNSLVPFTLAIGNWVLAIIGMRRARRENRPFFVMLLPILALNAFVALLVPLGRYSVPILPTLAILAGFGADTLLARRKTAEPAAPPAASA
jgi:4-amino-4-deoxy-L-arabinose transferase-like glycosyltransferase